MPSIFLEGTLPRSYLLEKDPKVDDLPEVPEKLNERQKTIVSFLADRITARPTVGLWPILNK